MLHKFNAEIRHSPPVTMLHTLTCPVCSTTADSLRVVRAQDATDAVLRLIETYMCSGVQRRVSVCNCTKGGSPADD